MTALSAAQFGLTDRGVLRPGAYADLVLFDPNTISDAATFEQPKTPAKGIVEVQWKCVAGDWCWFTAGTGEAKKLAVRAIDRIPRCFATKPKVRQNVRCRYCGRPSEDGSGVCARCERTYE